jgi:hypothetical protein
MCNVVWIVVCLFVLFSYTTNKTDRHNIAEILLKVTLSTNRKFCVLREKVETLYSDLSGDQNQDLQHSKWAYLPLHHRTG